MLHNLIRLGEDSTRQFKVDVRNAESLAAEMVAFSNSEGGTIYIGVADDGAMPGLSVQDVARINQLISPGHLPNNLTVEKIRTGNSNIRNPILVSYVAKGLLPYHGLGSGIKRALSSWPDIEFSDDRDGCLFTATVRRHAPVNAPVNAPEPSLQMQILNLVRTSPNLSYDKLAALTQKDRTTIMRNMAKLKTQGKLKRIGPAKGGYWQVNE